jgi:hypothetical protein
MIRQGTTLVIVDMQPDLPATHDDWLQGAVYQEIMTARAEGYGIVILEYMHPNPPRLLGETYQWLVSAAAGNSELFAMRCKATLDGSERVDDACTDTELPTERFRICGVNVHGCIQATVNGLAERFPDSIIEVAGSACNDTNGINWNNFKLLPNVQIV